MATTIWLLRSGTGPNVATVLSYVLAFVSTAATLWGFRKRPALASVARDLGRSVARDRERFLQQALADTAIAKPAPVTFRGTQAETDPELTSWRADHCDRSSGTIRDIAAYYQGLDCGRLTILGEPGAGKTVAATQLVLDLIHNLPAENPAPDSGQRLEVPVLFDLSNWNLRGVDAASASAEVLTHNLDKWLVSELIERHAVRSENAAELVAQRWVLPVLDGLDEMDDGAKGAGLEPRQSYRR